MFVIKARDFFGVWQHFNASDESFSDAMEELFASGFTDIEVYVRIDFEVTYSPGDLWL